ncbi:probable WRKY transcription factor 19 [Raphanus sativus]|uniref:Probable WRKY transcription factor 19 n=1 Tax=Raphanus sativus TaxID=3726 RepID=A0A6J0MGT0_RAPSA|nr:probable WRKY transcription factor 19 [Raphanus sativus]XP_018470737.2 probable WRKY transcription factor 19 [Raphanus sativus]XP_056858797.1 probable WRKY transcription factor 19 [Raphanus sativus]
MNSDHGLAKATGINKHGNMGDNSLSLKSLGDSQSHFCSDVSNCTDDGCRLVLGLGPTSASYCFSNKVYGSGFTQEISSRGGSVLQLRLPDTLSGLDCSLSTYTTSRQCVVPIGDEGSTSAKRSGGYMPSLLYDHSQASLDSSFYNTPKKCNFMGCVKGARGGSGLCISHGGGQRCQKPGCTKRAERKRDHCISHGGGRRCEFIQGCDKAARGKSGLCIKHGGGKRCVIESCTRSAEGTAGLCISHGGGKRCQFSSGCDKGAQGSTNYCKAHGGGKRCVFSGCGKGAEGSTPLCKAHGGGKRCMADGGGICPKSVHGGTNFCVAHGGGKRCVVEGCSKSARGRTDCCVKHGGGKRCVVGECGKSAQGSGELCKAHGGGKRCCWGDGGCEKFARGKSGLCAKHNSIKEKGEDGGSKSGLIGPGLFSGLVVGSSSDHSQKMMIPMQVLVPLSMKCPSDSHEGETNMSDFMIPEERVHGGGLMMSLLSDSLKQPSTDGI